eukprot:CAMPEP_0202958046 /NCGR_PEP_ID=MMETSP1396-20130829/2391_1 /ASSEMBLY_ACC=CAM_ASM_000872 /TAXON_ID= /ORGANISM="Pseudokeronopsis sp., Strain Brazil" /LENGTH=81 /DNA_ID=CAMNT_0049675857 /DNA_START=1130 /DNA_END=1375 /DNA_ORIENTATION=+
MMHFTTNTSPICKDKLGNYKLFSGDLLNTPTSEQLVGLPVLASIEEWINEGLNRSSVPLSSPVELYFDIGHFYWYIAVYPY